MKTNQKKLIMKLVMLLSSVAVALLMLWASVYIKADDTGVPTTEEIASITDAIVETTEATTEVATEQTEKESQSAGFSFENYTIAEIKAMFNIRDVDSYVINADPVTVTELYNGYADGTLGTLYRISDGQLGYCIQHSKSTATPGTQLTKHAGSDYFTNKTTYTNILKALYYMQYHHQQVVADDGGFISPDLRIDSAETKHDHAVCAFTCSYFNNDSTGLYNTIPDVKKYVDYVSSHSAPKTVLDDDSYMIAELLGDYNCDGYVSTSMFQLDGNAGLSYGFTVPTDCIVRVWSSMAATTYTDYQAGTRANIGDNNVFVILAKTSLNDTTSTITLTCNDVLFDFVVYVPTDGTQTVACLGTGTPRDLKIAATWRGLGSLELYKVSGDTRVTANNSCYSLKGAEYKLQQKDGSFLKDANNNDIVLITNEDGYAKVEDIPVGNYVLVETKASKGYTINVQPLDHDVTVTAGDVTTVNTVEMPGLDPVTIALRKTNSSNQFLAGAQYTIKYYKNQQTLNASALSESNLSDTWVMQTGDGTNGTLKGVIHLKDIYKVSGPAFYLDKNNNVGFPLGTVTIQETKAPEGYKRNDEIHVFYVKQNADGSTDIVGSTGIVDENDPIHDDIETELFVDLTLRKVNSDTRPAQGNTGDVSLEGAVFAIYARRDIQNVAAGTIAVKGGETYNTKTALKFANGKPVLDAYGNQVYAKAGDPKPVAIFDPTNKQGESVCKGLTAANNADDYYVRELVAPKGFKRNTNSINVDLRDNTNKDETVEAITYRYDVSNAPDKQPVQVYKYELIDDKGIPTIATVNGVEFQIYLISSLKNREDAVKFVNTDGSIVYDFANYDFSNETPTIIKADGSTKLVTGSMGIDGYDETMELYYGEYVLVETRTLDRLEPINPMVFTVPKYKTDANGVMLDTNGDPQKFAYCDLSVLNTPIEKFLKINKVNEEGKLVLHNKAKFSIWNVTDLDTAQIVTVDDIKANGSRIVQYQQTTSGMTAVDLFETNDEGFLMLFDSFKYGDYVIIEEEAPIGYTKAEPVRFRVRSNAIYLMEDGSWEECTTYTDAIGREYWEVSVVDVDHELSVAKVDSASGDFVPNAEMTIYKVVDAQGNIALDENNNPIILEANDAEGNRVQAVWNTSDKWVHFDAVPEGYYLIRETKTPDGYATREDVIIYVGANADVAPNGVMTVTGEDTIYYSFDKRDGGIDWVTTDSVDVNTIKQELVIPNTQITVQISKIDSATEGELPGAELTLYKVTDEGDEEIETWTSTDESHVIKGLTPGRYKLYENTVPLGFYTEKNTIEFDIVDTEEVQKCEMINHPIVVEVAKESFNAGTTVEGATLAIYRVSKGPWGSESLMNSVEPIEDIEATKAAEKEGLQLVDRWITDGTTHVLTGIYPGDYVLVEEKTPFGYTSSEKINFTITDQSSNPPIVMYDEKITCRIKIHKTGESLVTTELITTEYGDYSKFVWQDVNLEGVKFDVINKDGEIVQTIITDENGVAVSDELEFGKYTIKEHVPAGMVDEDIVYKVEFTWMEGMTETSLTATVEVYNESCNTQININKVGEEPVFVDNQFVYITKPLAGVLFGVYAQEDIVNYYDEVIVEAGTCVGYAVTDSNGVASLNEKLIKGKYYYQELKTAGVQYVADTNPYPFELILENSKIDVFNVNAEFPIVNRYVKGDIQIYKISQDGKIPLAGAEFDLYNSDGVVIQHLITDNTGKAYTMTLPWGKYYFKETKAPDTYQKVDTKFEAAVTQDGVTTIVTIENSKTPKLGATTMVTVGLLTLAFITSFVILIQKLRKKKA